MAYLSQVSETTLKVLENGVMVYAETPNHEGETVNCSCCGAALLMSSEGVVCEVCEPEKEFTPTKEYDVFVESLEEGNEWRNVRWRKGR